MEHVLAMKRRATSMIF
uniref:Uncharacterized protein n=1 Tax=Arundo donax TaxID=35708 RepID=A0A0A9CE35_ARUDO